MEGAYIVRSQNNIKEVSVVKKKTHTHTHKIKDANTNI